MKTLLAFILAIPVWAAIPTTTIWEIRSTATGGTNVNAGGFDYGNANFTTDLACTSATGTAPVCSSATYNFVAGNVGAWLFVQSGTNWYANQFCPIASVASNQATLNAAIGACVVLSNNRWIANTVAGVASVGSPTGGVWGVDYSQQDDDEIAYTDLVIGATTTEVTSAAFPFGRDSIGNSIIVSAGSGCTVQRVFVMSVATVTATLDKSAGTGASTCTANLGGAFSSITDAILELATSSATAANRYFIKGGTAISYTVGTVTISTGIGNAVWPVVAESYATLRGDRPTGSTRPTLAMGTSAFTGGNQWDWYGLQWTGTAATVLSLGSNSKLINSKCVNSSTTADRSCVDGSSDTFVLGNELVSYRGAALTLSGSSDSHVVGNYIHDSKYCITSGLTSGSSISITGNVLAGCTDYGIRFTGAAANTLVISSNTIHGRGTPTASSMGLSFATGTTDVRVYNNIITGFATGISHADTQAIAFSDFNNLYNNTAASSATWQSGPNSRTLDPQYAGVTELSGATATVAISTLTQSGGDFSTIADNEDHLYIVSGTGATAGSCLITSHTATTVTCNITLWTDATGDTVWKIRTGHNFAIGTNLKALGFPGAFPAALTTAYTDIGGVQRQEAGGGATTVKYPILK